MTGVGRPLGWDEIEAYLLEVGAELEYRGLVRSIVVVGGAYVAFRAVRASTTDVDTIDEFDDELRAAVAAVAERHGLEVDWLRVAPGRGDPSPSTGKHAKPSCRPVVSRFWSHLRTSWSS